MSDSPDDLDGLVQRADPDRWLASRFIGEPSARADIVALYAFDHELARAPKVASNAILGEIRLTWWREVLDEIFEDRGVRRHPTAQALAAAVRRRDLPRDPLEAMIEGRYRELDATPFTEADALDWARDTGGRAAELAARILDPAARAELAAAAGSAWALARRVPQAPELKPTFERVLVTARTAACGLSVAAFPAVAHAALARDRASGADVGQLGRRLKLTVAVALGRI